MKEPGMKIQRTILPGQRGTKKWVDHYGKDLVCVRYRKDAENKEKCTTVEIIIDRQKQTSEKTRIPMNKLIKLRIDYGEKEVAQQVKALGGRWDRDNKVWKLPFKYVRILRLEDRIVK